MKQRHYTEAELEQLAVRSDPEPDHLALCFRCRERMEFLRRLHAAENQESAKPVDPRLAALALGPAGSGRVLLLPFVPKPDLSDSLVRNGVVVLAAQGGTEVKGRFVTIGTFAAEERQLLLRVVHDRDKQRYVLYLLSERPEDSRHAHITITSPEGRVLNVTTDDEGHAAIEGDVAVDFSASGISVEPSAT